MTDLHTFNEVQQEAIRALRRVNMSWTKISAAFGSDSTTVRRAVDPEYRAKRAAQIAANKSYGGVGLPHLNGVMCAQRRSAAQDASARLAEIPADTRNLTARMFGDPLPGRSALDRRLQHTEESADK